MRWTSSIHGGDTAAEPFLPEFPCTESGVLEEPPALTCGWWRDLEQHLRARPSGETPRRVQDPIAVCRRVWVLFGVEVDTDVRRWEASRGGLTWTDLRPDLPVLADIPHHVLAPRGYDAASLLVHSLAVPDVAAEIAHRFRDELATDDGVVSQLFLMASMLTRAEAGEHLALVDPIHRQVDRLIGRPALLRPSTA